MAAPGAASSTVAEASHAAMQALHAEPGQPAGTAVDGLVAGVLAVAAMRPEVLLGALTILLGGTGEGLRVVDGRARQPGLDSPRPRGFLEGEAIPDAARIAAPALPSALAVAHAGRGERTLGELARIAVASSRITEKTRLESIASFGRTGATLLSVGAIRDALLSAGARSIGGVLAAADLDAMRPSVESPRAIGLGARRWFVAPWLDVSIATPPSETSSSDATIEIVAVVDARGAFAIAGVAVAAESLSLPSVGLAAPLLAVPVRRGVRRIAPGAQLPLEAPLALSQPLDRSVGGSSGIDLALGVGRSSNLAASFGSVVRSLADATGPIDATLAGSGVEAAIRGVRFDGRNARAIEV